MRSSPTSGALIRGAARPLNLDTIGSPIHAPMMHIAHERLFLAILAAGLLLRLVVANVAYPGMGLASDLGLFESWATGSPRSRRA
jgi:hypothetical protein